MTILKMLGRLTETVEEMDEDLRAAQEENEDKQFQIDEKDEEIEALKSEIRILCSRLYEAGVSIPRSGHSIDINALVPKVDPHRGQYEFTDTW